MRQVNPIYHHSKRMLIQELEWIELAQQNPKYFAPIYKKYRDQIFRYIFHRVQDESWANDITSQVFLKAIKNIKKYEYRGVPMSSWLYRVAKSELNQAFRDRKRKKYVDIDDEQLATFSEVFKDETLKINKQRLTAALQKIKLTDLQLIELRYFENRPYREIGDMLEITENNAKVKTYRAIRKLKHKFDAIPIMVKV